jgi:hypothetical protein
VLVLLAIAGLLRPEAWLMAGLYFLWVAWPASWRQRAWFAALAAAGPAIWVLSDWIVTGKPLYSLTYTSAFAEELGRATGGDNLPATIWEFLVKLDKITILLGGIVGLLAAVLLVPRRTGVPIALLAVGLATFVAVGVGGFSVIDRYLLVASLVLMVFCAVALGGWTMVREGAGVRRWWSRGALLVLAVGVVYTAIVMNLDRLNRELRFRGDSHAALHALLADPAVRAGMKCGPINVPNHKLIPDVRWIEGLPDRGVLARSQALHRPRLARRIAGGGVQIIPHERLALFRQALVSDTDKPQTVLPLPGFERVAVTSYYAAYVRCQ